MPVHRTSAVLPLLLCLGVALLGCRNQAEFPENEEDYVVRIERQRAERDDHYRTTKFNAFGLLQRHYFDDEPRLAIGSGPDADLKIADPEVAAVHAVIEGLGPNPTLAPRARIVEVDDPDREIGETELQNRSGFRIGRYHLRFNVSRSGRRNVEVYDPTHPNVAGFESLEYFPVDSGYRVWGTIVPYDDPRQVALVDSQDGITDYFLFGELHFNLEGQEQSLELYTRSLDPERIARDRHMVIFRDRTSGKETYPAARYLWVEGKTRGEVEVDFNLAFNPSCNYSYIYECPLPRPNNTLAVAVRAGEKNYKKHTADIPMPDL